MDILNEIREHAFTEAFHRGLLIGPKIGEIELPSKITHQFVDYFISDIKRNFKTTDIFLLKEELLKGFIYMFDKGIELAYFSRIQQESQIEYNFGDLMNGISGVTFPIYIQEQVNPIVFIVGEIFLSTLEFIKINELILSEENIRNDELIKLLMVGGAFLGVEYCLRIELKEDF